MRNKHRLKGNEEDDFGLQLSRSTIRSISSPAQLPSSHSDHFDHAGGGGIVVMNIMLTGQFATFKSDCARR
jgi:hypothetical protein